MVFTEGLTHCPNQSVWLGWCHLKAQLGWVSKMVHTLASNWHWLAVDAGCRLGALLGLFPGAPPCDLSLWLGLLTSWWLDSKWDILSASVWREGRQTLPVFFKTRTWAGPVSLLPYSLSPAVTGQLRFKRREDFTSRWENVSGKGKGGLESGHIREKLVQIITSNRNNC